MKQPPRTADCRFENAAEFRFYAELNDFLRPEQRKQTLIYRFNGNPGIKDPIEVFGVPHTEVDLITVNAAAVGFGYRLRHADRVAVYPVFGGLDRSPLLTLHEAPRSRIAFVVDVNLGKLARLLRLFGFDTLFTEGLKDTEIAALSAEEQRTVLTRDRRLLFAKVITHGYWVRAVEPLQQLAEVIQRFDLESQMRPFCRCSVCNGLIEPVEKQAVWDILAPKTRLYYDRFYRCPVCGKVYWEGSHVEHMRKRFAGFLGDTAI